MLLAVVKVNAESRRLTVKDFNVIGFNNATSDFLGKFEDGIVMYKDKEEPDSYCYYPGSSGSFTRHYEVNRSVYRHDTYSSDEYNITIRSNYTNIPHPLGIKIGTKFNVVMDRLDLNKISNSSIKVLDVYETVYIEGNSDSKESIYAGYFGGDYCVAFSFIISKKTCTTTYGEVLFTFDEKDRLKEITYTLREDDYTPQEDFIFPENRGDLAVSNIDFEKGLSSKFPEENMTWTDYTDPDGKTGGKVGYSDRLSVAYALRPGKPSSEFYGFMVFSNEYSGYFPCGIEIGDSFETVMTKYNAPQKDILKLLGVDDISEWNGERINLYKKLKPKAHDFSPWDEGK